MPTGDEGSVTIWIGHLKAGDHSAAHHLWDRYFHRMVGLARQRLRTSRAPGTDRDEEDAALSAFDSLFQGVVRGQFGRLEHRDDLWQLMVTITSRKALDQIRHRMRAKRGGGRVVNEAALADGPDDIALGLDDRPGEGPGAEFEVMAAEECERLLDDLGDESLRAIALLKMDGHTGEEIAARLGCSLRTVANKLKLIRMKWEREIA